MTWTRASSHLMNSPSCQTSGAISGFLNSFLPRGSFDITLWLLRPSPAARGDKRYMT
jgi:hypothetical protein